MSIAGEGGGERRVQARSASDPIRAASAQPTPDGGQRAAGAVCFFTKRAYRRSQGVGVNLAFKRIPIE